MYNIIAIIGEAGCGKDRILQEVLKVRPDFHEIISCTTRPMREGEQHGVNYFYYTADEFAKKIFNDEMLECAVFNDWVYGTSYDSVKDNGVINIGVFNPDGIESLLARDNCDTLIIRLKTKDKTRLLRQLNREENPNVDEIIRRYKTDKEDFQNIAFDYTTVENNQITDIDKAVSTIVRLADIFFIKGQNILID